MALVDFVRHSAKREARLADRFRHALITVQDAHRAFPDQHFKGAPSAPRPLCGPNEGSGVRRLPFKADQPKGSHVDTTLDIFHFDLMAYHQMLFRVRGARKKWPKDSLTLATSPKLKNSSTTWRSCRVSWMKWLTLSDT